MTRIYLVPISAIQDNPYQARTEYGDIEELAKQIESSLGDFPETLGLMQPPQGRLVNPDDPTETFELKMCQEDLDNDPAFWKWCGVQLAFGHRRLRAFQHLTKNSQYPEFYRQVMPVVIRDMSDDGMINAVYAENAKRKDISAVEEARLLAAKMAMPNGSGKPRTQAQLAKEWQISRSSLANKLRLVNLPDELARANIDGRLSERQCIALLPLLDVQRLATGSVSWMARPETYLENLLKKPEGKTSDEIRQYTQNFARAAGVTINDNLATFKAEMTENVIQPQCKGCKARFNRTTCLNNDCLKAKKEQMCSIVLAEASQELGMETSSDKKDFPQSYSEVEAITELFNAASDNSHFVIRIDEEGTGLRPFCDSNWIAGETFLEEPKKGIVIGIRGGLDSAPQELIDAAENAAAADEDTNLPSNALKKQWEATAESFLSEYKLKAMKLLTHVFIDEIKTFNVLYAIAGEKFKEGAHERRAKEIVKFMMGKFVNDHYDKFVTFTRYENVIARAGIEIDASPVDVVTILLFSYHDRRSGYTYRYAGNTLKSRLEDLLEMRDSHTDDLLEDGSEIAAKLLFELDRAIQDASQMLEAHPDFAKEEENE
jgi:ParB/RepB/Spo0J family partition protein